MRVILFKAKRKDNGEWVEGCYVICRKHHYILPTINVIIGYDEREDEYIEIDPDTLCQYTGQRYKCGKKVSENDIVTISAYSYDEPESDTTGVVVYSKGKACWCLKDLNSDEIIPMYECYGSYITQISYIGNTFDNPDLLEAE